MRGRSVRYAKKAMIVAPQPEPTEAGRLMPALRVRDFNFTSLSDAV